ncbi:MAG: MarR family winged helix-turn-helix transcriptional regulator [Solimonas sp.]
MLIANKLGALAVLAGDLSRAAGGDLSPTAVAILLTLHHRGPMTASELAVIAGITQPTAVRVTNGLVAHGLVRRSDRVGKTAPIHLTRAGAREARSLQKARLIALQRLVTPLADEERTELEGLLDKMLAGATGSRRFARTTCRLCDHALCNGPACPIGTRATEIEARG